jgi:hypothetical protein
MRSTIAQSSNIEIALLMSKINRDNCDLGCCSKVHLARHVPEASFPDTRSLAETLAPSQRQPCMRCSSSYIDREIALVMGCQIVLPATIVKELRYVGETVEIKSFSVPVLCFNLSGSSSQDAVHVGSRR